MNEENTEAITEDMDTTTPVPRSLDDLEPKMKLKGKVVRLELYGAFIDVGIGVNALIHISQLGHERVNRVTDVLNEGDEVAVWVDKVDAKRNQLMVSMVEPLAVEWRDLKVGQVYSGVVRRLEDFGAFVDIGAEREGLVHISELSHDFVKHPGEVLSVGSEIEVKVLGFNRRKRRIDLSVKALIDEPEREVPADPENGDRVSRHREGGRGKRQRRRREPEVASYVEFDVEEEAMPTAMEIALRKAMGDDLPARSKGSQRRQRRKGKVRAQQDDILNRTLQMQEEK